MCHIYKRLLYLVLIIVLLTGCVKAQNVESIQTNSSTPVILYTDEVDYSVFSDIKQYLSYNISPNSHIDFEKKIPSSDYFLKGVNVISYDKFVYTYAEDVIDFVMVEDILIYLTGNNHLHMNIKSCPMLPLPSKSYTNLSLSPLGLLLIYNNETVLEVDIFNCEIVIELKKSPDTDVSAIGPFVSFIKENSLQIYFVGKAQSYDSVTMPFDIAAINMSLDGRDIYILDVLGDLAIYSISQREIVNKYNVGTYTYKAYIDSNKDLISYLYNNKYNLVKIEKQELSNFSSLTSWDASLVSEYPLELNSENCIFSIFGGYLKCGNKLFYTNTENLSKIYVKESEFFADKFAFRDNVYYYLTKGAKLLVHSPEKRYFDNYDENEFDPSFACVYQGRYLYFLDVDREAKFYDIKADVLISATYSNFCNNTRLENGSYVNRETGEKLYSFAKKVNENSRGIMYRRDINNSKYYFFEVKTKR